MTKMIDTNGYQAFAAIARGAAVDYSYVFGTRKSAVRHDPHAHRQQTRRPDNLREISDLITRRPAADANEAR